jgi:uncharacterized membrane protein
MANWIFFVIIAQFIWGITCLIDKFIISKGHIKNPWVFIVVNGLTNILLIFILPFASLSKISYFDFFITLAGSLASLFSIVLYYKAVGCDEISRVAILFQLNPVFTFFLSGIFFGETLTGKNFAGFCLLLGAGLLVSYKQSHGSFRLSKSFFYMLASGFFVAIAYLSAGYILKVTSFWNAFLWMRITGLAILFVLLVPAIRIDFMKTFRKMGSFPKSLVIIKMPLDFLAGISIDLGILAGPLILVSAMGSSTAPLFVFILALLVSIFLPNIIKEDIDKKTILIKAAAILLVIAGIMFIDF